MELQELLGVIYSPTKIIQIDLFNENDLLLISFALPGYDCLDDFLLDDEVTKIEILSLTKLEITIDTSQNA